MTCECEENTKVALANEVVRNLIVYSTITDYKRFSSGLRGKIFVMKRIVENLYA